MPKRAFANNSCVACGACVKACPFGAIGIRDGVIAHVDANRCIGCGACARTCPAETIEIRTVNSSAPTRVRPVKAERKRHWYDYLFILTPLYLALGFFNILFAWIGLAFFLIPLVMAIAGKGKTYCNRYCDRGQFFTLLGERLHLSRRLTLPRWIRSRAFRYGFLLFFMAMFANMLFVTWMVFSQARDLGQSVQLLWTFSVPWSWAYPIAVQPGVAQFAFGFYSMMLTSNIIGLVVMALFRPRAWCVFCPMGTMTQLISKARAPKEA